jgi:hypothetical protein
LATMDRAPMVAVCACHEIARGHARSVMHGFRSIALSLLCFLITTCALAQGPIWNALRMTTTDMAETKEKAEAGDPRAQLAMGDVLANKNRPAEALSWYRKAGEQGEGLAVYRWGRLLWKGARGSGDQVVQADPVAGMQLIFRVATNGYAPAYYDMYTAYRDGAGVKKDVVESYAWIQMAVDSDRGILNPHRQELNNLALAVDVATAQEGKRRAAAYKRGQWPQPVFAAAAPAPAPKPALPAVPTSKAAPPAPAPKVVREYPGLKLSAIAPGARSVATISGKVVAEGEKIIVPLKPKPISIQCLKIEKNSVLILVEDETEMRELRLK